MRNIIQIIIISWVRKDEEIPWHRVTMGTFGNKLYSRRFVREMYCTRHMHWVVRVASFFIYYCLMVIICFYPPFVGCGSILNQVSITSALNAPNRINIISGVTHSR